MTNNELCSDCGGLISIRNPTGECDHLHYPENKPNYKESKTLKDFEKICACGSHKESHNPHYTDDNDLKQEAIKEIKHARDSKNGTKGLFGGGINFMFTKDVIGYIKWKFNVKEEELK